MTEPGPEANLVKTQAAALARKGPAALAKRGLDDLRAQESGVEILSNTLGVDFGPYLRQVIQATQSSWHPLIPQAARPPLLKKAKVAIQFVIAPGGSVEQMQLILPSGDVSLDRAAWGGITGAAPFPPLPKQFKGPSLILRFYFRYNEQPGGAVDGRAQVR